MGLTVMSAPLNSLSRRIQTFSGHYTDTLYVKTLPSFVSPPNPMETLRVLLVLIEPVLTTTVLPMIE